MQLRAKSTCDLFFGAGKVLAAQLETTGLWGTGCSRWPQLWLRISSSRDLSAVSCELPAKKVFCISELEHLDLRELDELGPSGLRIQKVL